MWTGTFAIVGAVLAMVAAALWRSIRAHGRIESRVRVMELLARALVRGRSLPALFERLHEERPNESFDGVATALRDGAPLGDALQGSKSPLFAAPWPDLVRAVEGESKLAPVLQTEARAEAHQGRFFERLLISLVYPGVLAFGVVAVYKLLGWVSGKGPYYRTASMDGVGVAAIALSLIIALLVLRLRGWPSWLPRFRSDRPDRARVLRVLSALLDDGMPLHAALERVQRLAQHRGLRRAVARAALEAANGEDAPAVLAFLGRGRYQKARIRGATSASLLERLRSVAERMDVRARSRQQYLLQGMRPAAVLVFGVFVLIGYAWFMQFIVHAQNEAMPW